ncbi:hypothetical protein T440DRAFT_555226 [Plenodomus tracheiphilus IPT5]|uniref:Uncharacterized protein n=1 Tax=Plenodomus tracheiphilus IPT5 TaxID=1408161 RepID=A0A6A7B4H1_9PLEO|nr:hypothetical protein T440DRAFT_555226 [Plenodomus tracheiphilus IPT5]
MASSALALAARRTSKYSVIFDFSESMADLEAPLEKQAAEPCRISVACQDERKRQFTNEQKYVALGCDAMKSDSYFECVCRKTNSLGANDYYDSHCVFSQCADGDRMRAFIRAYREACDKAQKQLVDIPGEWAAYAQDPLLPRPSSGSATSSSTRLSSVLTVDVSPTGAATTVMSIVTITSAAASTLQTPSKISSTATETSSVGPSSSYGAGFQFPICNIEPHCMRKGDNKPMCDNEDFKCICKVSNSMAKNTQFDQQCVLDECTGDISKEAGISIGILAVLAILIVLGITFYRAKRKVKQVQKRNAELVDRQSAHGVSAYIRNLTGKSTASLPLTEGGTTMIGGPLGLGKKSVARSLGVGEGLQRRCSESEYGDEIVPVGVARGDGVWDEGHGAGGQGGASGYVEHIQRGRQGVYPQRGEVSEERQGRGYYD